ncbi:hypothetical protein FHG87_018818 [Trinorchestia longiramus]|nr:hypothetical protein FHG87_018818 [Trinorchestia longiramus]
MASASCVADQILAELAKHIIRDLRISAVFLHIAREALTAALLAAAAREALTAAVGAAAAAAAVVREALSAKREAQSGKGITSSNKRSTILKRDAQSSKAKENPQKRSTILKREAQSSKEKHNPQKRSTILRREGLQQQYNTLPGLATLTGGTKHAQLTPRQTSISSAAGSEDGIKTGFQIKIFLGKIIKIQRSDLKKN